MFIKITRNLIKNFIYLFFISLVSLSGLAILEFSTRAFNYINNYDTEDDWFETKPKAFRNEANYSEIKKSLDGTCKYPALQHRKGTTTHIADFSCGGITYIKDKRLTLPILKEWNKTIHIFGGSTVMGVGSDDAFTIPSIIQREFANDQLRVLNYGVSSFIVKQQNEALKAYKGDIKKGDMVIYYDGGNDFWNGVMLDNLGGNMVGFNRKHKYQLGIFIIRNWLGKNSSFYRLLSDLKHNRKRNPDICNVNSKTAAQRVSQSANHLSKQVNEAREISKVLGAEFLHFYQPTLFDIKTSSFYEKRILSRSPCFLIAKPFKKVFDDIFLNSAVQSIDLSNVLEGKDLFFDYIHVSSQGNKIISDFIIKNIKANNFTK